MSDKSNVKIKLDWDSGPYSNFHIYMEGSPLYGDKLVEVPHLIWHRYTRLCAEVSELERAIEECPIVAPASGKGQ